MFIQLIIDISSYLLSLTNPDNVIIIIIVLIFLFSLIFAVYIYQKFFSDGVHDVYDQSVDFIMGISLFVFDIAIVFNFYFSLYIIVFTFIPWMSYIMGQKPDKKVHKFYKLMVILIIIALVTHIILFILWYSIKFTLF